VIIFEGRKAPVFLWLHVIVLHVTSAVVFGCFFACLLSRGKINPLCANGKKGDRSLKPLLNTFPAGVSVHRERN